jgi:hypothetical protein
MINASVTQLGKGAIMNKRIVRASDLTVAKMQNSDVRYTTPWAVFTDGTRYFIRSEMTLSIAKVGTSTLRLEMQDGEIYFDGKTEQQRREQVDARGNEYVVIEENRDSFLHESLSTFEDYTEIFELSSEGIS